MLHILIMSLVSIVVDIILIRRYHFLEFLRLKSIITIQFYPKNMRFGFGLGTVNPIHTYTQYSKNFVIFIALYSLFIKKKVQK